MVVKVIRDVGEKWARGGEGRGSSWLLMDQARGPGHHPSSAHEHGSIDRRPLPRRAEASRVQGAFLLCNVRSRLHVDTHLAHP